MTSAITCSLCGRTIQAHSVYVSGMDEIADLNVHMTCLTNASTMQLLQLLDIDRILFLISPRGNSIPLSDLEDGVIK